MSGGQDVELDRDEKRLIGLTIALRKLAIIPTMAQGVQMVLHNGHRCRVCATTWALDEPERHADDCALKGTER